MQNLKDQNKLIYNGFELSNHTFLNKLIDGLQEKITTAIPDLKINPIGKKINDKKIELSLVGQIVIKNEKDNTDNKVKQLMDSLKNPSNLLSLLE